MYYTCKFAVKTNSGHIQLQCEQSARTGVFNKEMMKIKMWEKNIIFIGRVGNFFYKHFLLSR